MCKISISVKIYEKKFDFLSKLRKSRLQYNFYEKNFDFGWKFRKSWFRSPFSILVQNFENFDFDQHFRKDFDYAANFENLNIFEKKSISVKFFEKKSI